MLFSLQEISTETTKLISTTPDTENKGTTPETARKIGSLPVPTTRNITSM